MFRWENVPKTTTKIKFGIDVESRLFSFFLIPENHRAETESKKKKKVLILVSIQWKHQFWFSFLESICSVLFTKIFEKLLTEIEKEVIQYSYKRLQYHLYEYFIGI